MDSRADARNRRRRMDPESKDVFAAAVELATSSAASLRRTARRFSLCADDAEDAYQRSLEILLTKAPTAHRDELRPWLHTVIKHEALALRRMRERSVSGEGDAAGAEAVPAGGRSPHEAATGSERARRAAEALGSLKPGELQCLILKALGYSYDEIADRTGFSWTKVNRSLTQGRRRFLQCFGEIAAGAACGRYQAALSAASDGQADADDERRLRAHLAACPGCRAALRQYRTAPARLAELLPPAVVLPALDRPGTWSRLADWLAATVGERAAAVGLKVHQGAEVMSAQKTAAVVASTAAIAGGGVAVKHADPRDADRAARSEQAAATTPAPSTPAPEAPVPPSEPAADPEPAPAPAPAPPDQAKQPAEFGFEHAEAPAPSAPAPASRAEFAGPGGGPQAAAGGGGEFGP
jgi:RNA polymerase sigma factor (sigma-70 family)